MPRPVPIHRLRQNETEWSPAHVLFFDTETDEVDLGTDKLLTLKLWTAKLVDRRATKTGRLEVKRWRGTTAETLVDAVEEAVRGRSSLWLYAHNLSFDLATTRLPLRLIQRGWGVSDAAVSGRSPWLRMARGRARLGMFDSGSWLPMPLGQVGELVGIPKPPLPAAGDSEDIWYSRCESDTEILSTAMCQLMDWWDSGNHGKWNITGSSSGWNAFRHIPTVQRVVINPEPEGIKCDRAAIYGGRRSVWRVGEMRAGPFLELDFEAAYPTIAAHLQLPLQRRSRFSGLPVNDWRVDSEDWGIVAHCHIRTGVPVVPLRTQSGVFYPVGEFRTTIAGPDIRAARDAGALVAIGAGYVHQMGKVMQPWAQWILDIQSGRNTACPDVARVVAKQWGRTVIGKWAAHGFEKTALGPSPSFGWGYEEGFDVATNSHGGMVDIGGQRWWVATGAEPDNAYPAVLGWVESEVRVRLNRVISALGRGAVIQCDTDGLIVSEPMLGSKAARGEFVAPDGVYGAAKVEWVLQQLAPLVWPLRLRLKRSSRHLTVIGPQHVQTDSGRRYSGIPGMATRDERGHFVGHLWPKLQWQMANGDPRGYVRPHRDAVIGGVYAPGWVTSKGTVLPVEARITEQGTSVLVPWHSMTSRPRGVRLGDVQNPELRDLY